MLLKQLLLLNTLQSYNSFREAASALQKPESSLRSAIHSLEKELGCTLVTTDKKGIHWTETGQQILLHTEQLQSKTRQLYRLQDLLYQAFSHKISIASSSQYGSLILTEIITEIMQEYPSAHFSLSTRNNQALLQLLISQQIDLALLQIHEIEQPLPPGGSVHRAWAFSSNSDLLSSDKSSDLPFFHIHQRTDHTDSFIFKPGNRWKCIELSLSRSWT